jgi:hypothetical protein
MNWLLLQGQQDFSFAKFLLQQIISLPEQVHKKSEEKKIKSKEILKQDKIAGCFTCL